jgi:hypothetical protein
MQRPLGDPGPDKVSLGLMMSDDAPFAPALFVL